MSISRQYFSSGAAVGGRSSKKHEEGEFVVCLFHTNCADALQSSNNYVSL